MLEIQEGYGREMTRLFKKYARPVYGVCYRYVKDHQTALDLRQEVFLKVIRHFESFRRESATLTWLYRISVNCCLDYLRRQKRRFEGHVLADSSATPFWEIPDRHCNFERDLHVQSEIEHFLSTLPSTTQLVVHLHHVLGYPLEQVSLRIGIPYLEVRRHLARFARRVQLNRTALNLNPDDRKAKIAWSTTRSGLKLKKECSEREGIGNFGKCVSLPSSVYYPPSLRLHPGIRGRPHIPFAGQLLPEKVCG